MSRKTWLGLGLVLAACGGEAPEQTAGRSKQSLAEAGPWNIPPGTLAIGDTQDVTYTGAGPWVGDSGCYGSMTPGNELLRDYLYSYFPQTNLIGGYACRPINGNPSEMSVHATGRALDIMIPLDASEADNGAGDPIGNWLIENAEAIGIQFIIWDLYTWQAARTPGEKGRDYGGAHPHDDHLHIELSLEASANTELWFLESVEAPVIDGCEPIPKEGGIIEETDACFHAFGPSEFWRVVDDAGSGDSLLWTNAWETDAPSNWGRWNTYVEESGLYTLEVYIDASWGVFSETRYQVSYPGGEDVIYIDQSTQQGWVSLGDYELSREEPTWIDVYDDVPGAVEDDQRIAVDALRITGHLNGDPGTDPPPKGPGPDSEDDSEATVSGVDSSDDGGCSVTNAAPRTGDWRWLALAGLVGVGRRRRLTVSLSR